jgi:hypothetical protein
VDGEPWAVRVQLLLFTFLLGQLYVFATRCKCSVGFSFFFSPLFLSCHVECFLSVPFLIIFYSVFFPSYLNGAYLSCIEIFRLMG